MKFEIAIEETPPFLVAHITCEGQNKSIRSTDFHTETTDAKRTCLRNFYHEIERVMSQKQFPEHTFQYGPSPCGKFAVPLGYPEHPL